MTSTDALLEAYDQQLRGDAEVAGAVATSRLGPLWLATFAGGQGFITHRGLDNADVAVVATLVADALEHFEADPGVREIEWKTRAHDHVPGLRDALRENGFEPDEPEPIMIGQAQLLAVDVPLPSGVSLRRVTGEGDVRAMTAMQDEVFGDPVSDRSAENVLQQVALDDGTQLWVAEADGQMVSAGRLQPVEGTDFAGIWGGATRPEWRGRGIYRALTAARARAALAMGKTLINSDSTEFSRPILERSGLVKVSATTPYVWRR